jgi:hypothetical protein
MRFKFLAVFLCLPLAGCWASEPAKPSAPAPTATTVPAPVSTPTPVVTTAPTAAPVPVTTTTVDKTVTVETKTESDWGHTIGNIAVLILQILGPILVILASWAAAKLAKKFGIEYSTAIDTQVRSLSKMAINYAEGWAKVYANKPASKDKMQVAVNFVIEALSNMGVKDYTRAQIEKFVEAQLQWDKKVNEEGAVSTNPPGAPPA